MSNSTEQRDRTVVEWLKEAAKYDYIKMACYFIVGGKGWDSENATPELLDKLAYTNRQISFKNVDKEEDKMWDRHAEYDAWQKALGGGGYNPKDAFGKIIADNPDKQYGVFIGPYHFADDLILAWTSVGIFWYRKSTGEANFATSESELPL